MRPNFFIEAKAGNWGPAIPNFPRHLSRGQGGTLYRPFINTTIWSFHFVYEANYVWQYSLLLKIAQLAVSWSPAGAPKFKDTADQLWLANPRSLLRGRRQSSLGLQGELQVKTMYGSPEKYIGESEQESQLRSQNEEPTWLWTTHPQEEQLLQLKLSNRWKLLAAKQHLSRLM